MVISDRKIIIILALASIICSIGYALSNNPDRLIGSRKSKRYHYQSCHSVKKIKLSNIRIFTSSGEAIKAGYIPCKICKPPTTKKEK